MLTFSMLTFSTAGRKTSVEKNVSKKNPEFQRDSGIRDIKKCSLRIFLPAVVTTASTATFATGLGFFHHNRPALQVRIVQFLDGSLGFIVIVHFHETESSGTAGEFVHNNFGGAYLSKCFECFPQIIILGVEA